MPQINYVKNSKLLTTFQLLSANEVKSLGKWLISPWCNPNKKLHELYLILRKHFPDFESQKLSKAIIFEKLYPGKTFNDRWLRNLMAELNKQIESFMVHQRLKEQEVDQRELMLAKEYEERNAADRSRKKLEALIERVKLVPNKSTDDYAILVDSHAMLYYTPQIYSDTINKGIILKQVDQYLDHHFLLHKWRYQTEIFERKKIITEDYGNLINPKLLDQLNPDVKIPALSFYKSRIANDLNISTESFTELIEDFEKNAHLYSIQDQKLIYFYLLNSGIKNSYQNKISLYKAIFQFHILGLRNKYLIHHDKLSVTTFCNIVVTGNNAKEFKAVSKFINQYHELLDKDFQIEGKSWGTAHVHFNSNDFISTLNILSLAKFSSKDLLIRSRYLLSVTYFKIRQEDHSYIAFFKDYALAYIKFLKRIKGKSPYTIKSYLNNIKYCLMISDALESPTSTLKTFQNIHQSIASSNPIATKLWLLNESTNILKRYQ